MSRRIKMFLASGVTVLLATVIISLICIDEWHGLANWAFVTMLWSEIVLFGGSIFIEWFAERSKQIFARSLLYSVIITYSTINFLISVFYMILLKEAATSFTVMQVIMLASESIGIAVSLGVSKGVQKSNIRTAKAVANTEAMIERLNKLALRPECEHFVSSLKKLSDDLRFTDISKVVAEDSTISNAISVIEIETDSTDGFDNKKSKQR